jgi:ankyrin repeat protein
MHLKVASGFHLRLAIGLMFSICVGAAPDSDALLVALRAGHRAEVQRLVDRGAAVNVVDDRQSSALMYAAIYADTGTMRLLLAHGADPNHADE